MGDNHQLLIGTVPQGALRADDFVAQVVPTAPPEDGEVLLQTLAVTIGAGQRAGLQGSASYAGAASSGVVMGGTGVGRVVESRSPAFSSGDMVMGPTGWQSLPTVAADQLIAVDGDLDPALLLGPLGINGLTAYFGLHDIGHPGPGDTVVVSAAAGSVGHMVGQMGRLAGAKVVGVAGSEAKCDLLCDRLGFDAAVNYRADDFRDRFKAATPERIDVYFDNTGGDILASALFRMAVGGRIVCCGAVSQYDTSTPGPGPRGIPGLLVNNRVTMQGFLVFDFEERYAEARTQISSWLRQGELDPLTTEYAGLEAAPGAFVDLLAGATVGTTVVRLDP